MTPGSVFHTAKRSTRTPASSPATANASSCSILTRDGLGKITSTSGNRRRGRSSETRYIWTGPPRFRTTETSWQARPDMCTNGALEHGAKLGQMYILGIGLVRSTFMRLLTDVTAIVERTTLTVTSRVPPSMDVIPGSSAHPWAHARRINIRLTACPARNGNTTVVRNLMLAA